MRKIFKILICLLFTTSWVIGQNPMYKSGITFKKLFLDYQSQNGGKLTNFNNYRHGWEIGWHRMLSEKTALSLPLRYGVVDSPLDSLNCLKTQIASFDAQFQYHFENSRRRVTPYVFAGVGGVHELKGDFNVQIPVGLGLFFRIAPKAFIHWQSEYRYALAEKRSNIQHGIGFTYLFGKSDEKDKEPTQEEKMVKLDSDNDGVPDELDLCPNAFGSRELNGCPDKDGDGVPDYLDKCPESKGLSQFMGCPDSDGDGVPDNEDECPNIAGSAKNKGCPEIIKDSDGDGVPDTEDKCPNNSGPAAAGGCPDKDGDGIPDKDDKCPDRPGLRIYFGCPDTDGDGIDDSRDKCPNVAGTVANDGCPEIKKEDKKTLEVAMQAVQFQTGSAILKPESNIVLSQIAEILGRYPDFIMTISGHTDNVGSESANQILSEKRAKTCYDFLIKKGIAPDRISSTGYGESRPITTNSTEKGKSLNRRVEFNLLPRP